MVKKKYKNRRRLNSEPNLSHMQVLENSKKNKNKMHHPNFFMQKSLGSHLLNNNENYGNYENNDIINDNNINNKDIIIDLNVRNAKLSDIVIPEISKISNQTEEKQLDIPNPTKMSEIKESGVATIERHSRGTICN